MDCDCNREECDECMDRQDQEDYAMDSKVRREAYFARLYLMSRRLYKLQRIALDETDFSKVGGTEKLIRKSEVAIAPVCNAMDSLLNYGLYTIKNKRVIDKAKRYGWNGDFKNIAYNPDRETTMKLLRGKE